MTKEEVLEKLEEEKESVKSKILYGQSSNSSANGCGWCFDVINHAIDLAEKIDEPKKVVIPEFIANDIDRRKKEGSTLRNFLKDVFDWGANDENFRKYISAWNNGYEVKKETEKHVRLKGFAGTTGYLNYDVTFEEFFVDTTELDGCTKVKFTKSWLKDNWPEYDAYNNAGLLEFEEVEDD